MMIFLRSLLFNIILFPWGFMFLLLHGAYLFGSRERSMIVLRRWATHSRAIMSKLLHLNYRVEGMENIPPPPYIIAAKHQSAWDTFIYPEVVKDPCFVTKKELTYLPLYGHFIKKFDHIPVDRSKGASALKNMISHAKRICFEQKRPIVIFPQGRRVNPHEQRPYQPGVAALYSQLKIPVVPAAVNSGIFWGRRTFLKKPGTIILKFLPPLQPGLEKKEFMEQLEKMIETESEKLLNRNQKGN